jgi:hypothetical protein
MYLFGVIQEHSLHISGEYEVLIRTINQDHHSGVVPKSGGVCARMVTISLVNRGITSACPSLSTTCTLRQCERT